MTAAVFNAPIDDGESTKGTKMFSSLIMVLNSTNKLKFLTGLSTEISSDWLIYKTLTISGLNKALSFSVKSA